MCGLEGSDTVPSLITWRGIPRPRRRVVSHSSIACKSPASSFSVSASESQASSERVALFRARVPGLLLLKELSNPWPGSGEDSDRDEREEDDGDFRGTESTEILESVESSGAVGELWRLVKPLPNMFEAGGTLCVSLSEEFWFGRVGVFARPPIGTGSILVDGTSESFEGSVCFSTELELFRRWLEPFVRSEDFFSEVLDMLESGSESTVV